MPSCSTPPFAGALLLAAVTDEMVALHERYHGRTPASADAKLLEDEVLTIVFWGIYTDVEKTMIELQREAVVKETRNAFHVAMQQRFIDVVERLSGREVLAFASDTSVGPDIEIELFVLSK
jgi:uncharacterized protein YbcI